MDGENVKRKGEEDQKKTLEKLKKENEELEKRIEEQQEEIKDLEKKINDEKGRLPENWNLKRHLTLKKLISMQSYDKVLCKKSLWTSQASIALGPNKQ